jgi:gluconolactonase
LVHLRPGRCQERWRTCYTAGGDLIAALHLPETMANLTFGGPKKNRLFIAASTFI